MSEPAQDPILRPSIWDAKPAPTPTNPLVDVILALHGWRELNVYDDKGAKKGVRYGCLMCGFPLGDCYTTKTSDTPDPEFACQTRRVIEALGPDPTPMVVSEALHALHQHRYRTTVTPGKRRWLFWHAPDDVKDEATCRYCCGDGEKWYDGEWRCRTIRLTNVFYRPPAYTETPDGWRRYYYSTSETTITSDAY